MIFGDKLKTVEEVEHMLAQAKENVGLTTVGTKQTGKASKIDLQVE